MLHNPALLENADPRIKTMWLWHAAEETEHKCTAFDVYQALGGNFAWRKIWFRRVSLIFMGNALMQTVSNLHHDGTLWKLSTWQSAWRNMLGKDGLLRGIAKPWAAYLQADFHPRQQDGAAAEAWLARNAGAYAVVGV